MYCAASVYILHAKDSPSRGLSNSDHQNLEFIINAMEAVGRQHLITRAFLQQVCLDVEANGVGPAIRMPRIDRYKHIFGTCQSQIPLLVRSSISRHTGPQSPLPGRLPLGNPTPGKMGDLANMATTAAAPGFGGKAGLAKFGFPTVIDEFSPPEDGSSGSSPDKEAGRGDAAGTSNKRKRMVSPVPPDPPGPSTAPGYPGGLFATFATAHHRAETAEGGPVFSSPIVGGCHCGTGATANLSTMNLPHRVGSATSSASQRTPSQCGSTPAAVPTATTGTAGSEAGQLALVEELLAEFGTAENWDVMNDLLVEDGDEDEIVFAQS
jgi:hypothetical protein